MKQGTHAAKWFRGAALLVLVLVMIGLVAYLTGWKALNVLTSSMEPAIHPGDLVVVKRVSPDTVAPGQIVTYTNPNIPTETITHRVIAMRVVQGTPMIITKGDANQVPDPPVPEGRLIGRVAIVLPMIGHLFGYLRNPLVLLLIVVVPGLYVIWTEVSRLKKLFGDTVPATPARRRRLDGLYRLGALAVVGAAVAVTAGAARAATVGPAGLVRNAFTAMPPRVTLAGTRASPSPTDCPATVRVQATAPNSHVSISCTGHATSSSHASTTVQVDSSLSQTATSGSVEVNGNTSTGNTRGGVYNSSSSQTRITISNP